MEEDRMIVDVLANDGSPLGVSTSSIYGDLDHIGVGGAELALLTLCEGWHDAGHDVRLYNSPLMGTSPFPQYPIDAFEPHEDRDVLIAFRSPNHRINDAKGMVVWWSCDQFTCGSFQEFAPKVDKIVTISPFHADYFRMVYGINDTITIDLPVRLWDYEQHVDKVPHRLIFCSVPDRGLGVLAEVYWNIVKAVPDVSMAITSDYRLWGAESARNEHHIGKFLGFENVRFLGAIPRMEMVREQLQAEIQAYPCNYDELFCYSVAECSVAGAYPITPAIGALTTTNMGTIVKGDILTPQWKVDFTDAVIHNLLDPKLAARQWVLKQKALARFSLKRILNVWNKRVFNG
jgi:hypothetical protein